MPKGDVMKKLVLVAGVILLAVIIFKKPAATAITQSNTAKRNRS